MTFSRLSEELQEKTRKTLGKTMMMIQNWWTKCFNLTNSSAPLRRCGAIHFLRDNDCKWHKFSTRKKYLQYTMSFSNCLFIFQQICFGLPISCTTVYQFVFSWIKPSLNYQSAALDLDFINTNFFGLRFHQHW